MELNYGGKANTISGFCTLETVHKLVFVHRSIVGHDPMLPHCLTEMLTT